MRVIFDGIPDEITKRWRSQINIWAVDPNAAAELPLDLHDTPDMNRALLELNRAIDKPIMFRRVHLKKSPYKGGWDGLDRLVLVEPMSEDDAVSLRAVAQALR